MAPAQYLQFLINSFTTSVRDKLSSIFTMRVLSCKRNGHVRSGRNDSQQTAVVRHTDKSERLTNGQIESQKSRQIDRPTDRQGLHIERQTDKKTD